VTSHNNRHSTDCNGTTRIIGIVCPAKDRNFKH